jgi:hypothetical protein
LTALPVIGAFIMSILHRTARGAAPILFATTQRDSQRILRGD